MQGRGIFSWTDGRKYVGDYKNDLKHGEGTFTWPDGRCYHGTWKDGKQHGDGIFMKDGRKRKGRWEMGKRIEWIRDKEKRTYSRETSLERSIGSDPVNRN